MMPSVVILHPLQLPAGWDLSGPHITKALPGATHYSKAEYTNTQQDLPVGVTTSPTLDMKGFWPLGFSF
jgi:hypothetical protein